MRARRGAGQQPKVVITAQKDVQVEEVPLVREPVEVEAIIEALPEADATLDRLLDPKTGAPWRYPNLHCLLYGEGAAGKSTFVAEYIKRIWDSHGLPGLVLGFDPPGKMWPYFELGASYGPPTDPEVVAYYANWNIAVTDVWDEEGRLVCRVEHYAEEENVNLATAAGMQANPKAWANFNARLTYFGAEAANWGVVAVDSMTGLIYANMCLQRAVKPMVAFEKGTDTRQWYAMATDDVEGFMKSRLPWWNSNVFVICHVAEDKEEFAEGTLRGVGLIGRLKKNAVQCYEEMWRMKVVPDTSRPGEYLRLLQTRSDSLWTATSLIAKASNPCLPNYDAVWEAYRRKKLGLGEATAPSTQAPITGRGPRRSGRR